MKYIKTFEGAKQEVFKKISYDEFEEWQEGRTSENLSDFEINYIKGLFDNSSYECEVDIDSAVMITLYKKDSLDGVGIRISKYNDEYFHILVEDIKKTNDEWETFIFSDGGVDFICDQVYGIKSALKYELKNSYPLKNI